MKLLLVSDAWLPQTNGVVNTLRHTLAQLERLGHVVERITPEQFHSLPCPTYPEIRLSLLPYREVARRIARAQPDAIHIATEGPLGFAAWRYCRRNNLAFTTSYHTQFPQYLALRFPVPLAWSYRLLRAFHGAAACCMVSTASVQAELERHGIMNIVRWRRGVDTQLFRPRDKGFLDLPRPVAAYIGRVAIEKNIEAFLAMDWSGSKLVIGDGPERARLAVRHPLVRFAGFRFGVELAQHLAAADIMVFPSRTDTFGLVNLEAMACGVPVAAYPVQGPRDVIQDGITGALDENLAQAALRALALRPEDCRAQALVSGWEQCTREFESNLVPARKRSHAHRAQGAQLAQVANRALVAHATPSAGSVERGRPRLTGALRGEQLLHVDRVVAVVRTAELAAHLDRTALGQRRARLDLAKRAQHVGDPRAAATAGEAHRGGGQESAVVRAAHLHD
jgi:glycosyltransferase involved in cell wall biosynthesis